MIKGDLFKSKVNRLYFVENMTVPEISKKLNTPYNTVLGAVERGDFYRFRKLGRVSKNSVEHVLIISNTVSEYFGLREGLINKRTSIRDVVVPRQIAQAISYNLTKSSNAFIGRHIGSVAGCTVTHSKQIILDLLSYNNETKDVYLELEKLCKAKLEEHDESDS